MRKIKQIIIHCSYTPPSMDIGVEEIREWHKERGWSDIGYHYVIRRDGTIEKGRPEEKVGAHTKGYNASSIGVCLVGGAKDDVSGDETNFTFSQYRSMVKLCDELASRYNATIHGHNEFNSHKTCPTFYLNR